MLACSMTGLVMVLYVVIIVSFCLPQAVYVRALSSLVVLAAFSSVFSMCSL